MYHSSAQNHPDGTQRGTILFLPDGFGLAVHNLRLADMYAQHGELPLRLALYMVC